MSMLSEKEMERYKRQMMIAGWGEETQELLKKKTVFVVGAGGLGSPVAINLAVAGVGEIRICDYDEVELSNLNRQLLHNTERVGMNKAESGAKTLSLYNDEIKIVAMKEKLTSENIEEMAGNADIIVDCLDNFDTRYIINEYAIKKHLPIVYGSVWGMDGRVTFINCPETPCLKCIFEEAPKKETFPIVGATTSVIGGIQAMEVIKYLTGIGQNLKNKLLVWEGARMNFKKFNIGVRENCPACSEARKE